MSALSVFHPAVAEWFTATFAAPTAAQRQAWPAIASGAHTLLLAPTGSGKTLAAFLACIDRLMFHGEADTGCRVVYVSPLKALASDVEKNLEVPLAAIAATAARRGDAHRLPAVALRTGDTPPRDRARFRRNPSDVLITTPESLYLMLTSGAAAALTSVETVIIDEIHALVPTKRGAHLMSSVERLEALAERPIQRIGLSATQRPLDEVARFLGGALAPEAGPEPGADSWRPVTICDAGARKPLALRVEMHDSAGPAAPTRESVWESIVPRLLELVRAHRSTLVFVNSRRIAERLAAALNELAGETLAHAHHGSLAHGQRLHVEDLLKQGRAAALVCTSSLELGIDMGAVDLVVQIEAPPSVASALQRIGRAGHSVGATSHGVIFPKHKGDLLACAALVPAMYAGEVEAVSYPRHPLDVLAQQIVAMAAQAPWPVEHMFRTLCRAAPFVGLPRAQFDGVLDMLSGRYAADDFPDLRPRVVWDRVSGTVSARQGSKHIAIASGGTIPDRGLYPVYLAGSEHPTRVGELDEEMVFESRVGEVFLLGASSWRIEEITHDRVLVSPAPGAPGKMPFWRGDATTRPIELGRKIGALVRALRGMPEAAAIERLVREHALDPAAAAELFDYVSAQGDAAPDDETIVIERLKDELGDWRVCLLSPLGGRVFAPWTLAIGAHIMNERDIEVDAMWTNDGIVLRFPATFSPPDHTLLLPAPEMLEPLIVSELGSSALFAARFRENAARALLLPRRRPGARTPLWRQRKRAGDLLAIASRYPGFPLLLETYRECLRDVFDLPALTQLLRDVHDGRVRVVVRDAEKPSVFASTLLFSYVTNYLYDGDAPMPERRAQALTIDHAQLKELLGEGELRELLDEEVMAALEAAEQQREPGRQARHTDAVHDLLLRLGDLDRAELRARCQSEEVALAIDDLVAAGRALPIAIGERSAFIAVEDAGRYRDVFGIVPPAAVPRAFLEPRAQPLKDLLLRYARTHAPFPPEAPAERFGLETRVVAAELEALARDGRLLEGAFRPHGLGREYADPEVLRAVRRRTLAKLRREVEPVPPAVYARMLLQWHGVHRPRGGPDALLSSVEQLQGAPLAASLLESQLLPARVADYAPAMLDQLLAAGDILWCGVEPLGGRDGRLALYLNDHLSKLWPGPQAAPDPGMEERIVAHLQQTGASFFSTIQQALGGAFANEIVSALWSLVWKGHVTNDTFRAVRAYIQAPEASRKPRPGARAPGRSSATPPSAAGRWSLVSARLFAGSPSETERATALAEQWLRRYGVVTREVATAEDFRGGFTAIYDVYRALEDAGRIRRGYFVTDISGMQFASNAAVDVLRALRAPPHRHEVVILAASDPANPYGALLPWPEPKAEKSILARSTGARVIIVDGALHAFLTKSGDKLTTFLPRDEPERTVHARSLSAALRGLAEREPMLLAEIDQRPAAEHPLRRALEHAGFLVSAQGLYLSRRPGGAPNVDV